MFWARLGAKFKWELLPNSTDLKEFCKVVFSRHSNQIGNVLKPKTAIFPVQKSLSLDVKELGVR